MVLITQLTGHSRYFLFDLFKISLLRPEIRLGIVDDLRSELLVGQFLLRAYAYKIVEQDEKAGKLFAKCAKDNLNNDDIRYRLYHHGQSEEQFSNQLHEIILPVYESAKNLGFREWVYAV